jgi:hypothetical protein
VTAIPIHDRQFLMTLLFRVLGEYSTGSSTDNWHWQLLAPSTCTFPLLAFGDLHALNKPVGIDERFSD